MPTGIEHGTVTVIVDGMPFEVTTLRRDVETYGRHATVAFTEDWEEDARRRDFTLNALYADRDGTVFDPIGGYGDLVEGRVRFIGDAEERIKEDYLRILRFFRFNAYYGKGSLDPDGLSACVKLRAGLDQLSAERVAGELRRILVAPQAVRAIEALFDYGLLTELLAGVPRIDALRPAGRRRGGAWTRPRCGTPARRARRLRRGGRRAACASACAFRTPSRLCFCLAHATMIRRELPDEAAARRALYQLGPCKFEAHVLLASADEDVLPDDQRWRQALRLADRWQAPEFPLRGPDITALGDVKGPQIGDMLRRLEAEWIASDFTLDRDALLAKARQLREGLTRRDLITRRGKGKRHGDECDLDQHVASAHGAGRGADLGAQELAEARVAQGPARIVQAVGRRQ